MLSINEQIQHESQYSLFIPLFCQQILQTLHIRESDRKDKIYLTASLLSFLQDIVGYL